eukprot:TRINITY_DN2169_c0_g1_i1.p2 TRINITY_DN2169_c0_g1~~TRINITY_DN2169_c0_g1_i1.p2  ORF type:complete len:286 (-),score=105.14 TRINITY_DN2169_c0_g1_i1:121-978(-)
MGLLSSLHLQTKSPHKTTKKKTLNRMQVKNALLLVAFVGLLLALSASAQWGDRLDATYGDFSTVPLTVTAATKSGWVPYDDNCGTYGRRYIYKQDPSILTMYGGDNTLQGVQVTVENKPPTYTLDPWEVQPSGNYSISLYFREPENICTNDVVYEDATTLGDRLALRNGNTGNYINLPLKESQVDPVWTKGACFVAMGTHYWYNTTVDMDCDRFYPIGLMYNGGNLATFLVNIDSGEPGSRWEHPSGSSLNFFWKSGETPKCLFDAPAISTIHFFVYNPILDTCL